MVKEALLVIDVQKVYESRLKVNNSEAVLDNINKLIRSFKEKNKPIIYIRHMHKPDGSDAGKMYSFTGQQEKIGFLEDTEEVEYIDELLLVEGAQEIIKHRYSSFVSTNLDKILKETGIEKIVISGFMTNFCCESTARDAHDRDYYVDFIIDATGTPDLGDLSQEQIKSITAGTLSEGFANVLTIQEFLSARE